MNGEWINVQDRLPEEGIDVLTCRPLDIEDRPERDEPKWIYEAIHLEDGEWQGHEPTHWLEIPEPPEDMQVSDQDIARINERAREIIKMDRDHQWREAINIVGYSVFEDGVNVVPKLVAEIRRLKKELKEQP